MSRNRYFEALEAGEVTEADEVNKVAEIIRPEKSLMRTKTFGKIETANAIFWMYLGGTA